MGCQLAIKNQQGQRSSPSAAGKPGTHAQNQRPHVTSPATKHGEAEKTKSCRYPSIHQVCNASFTTKANKVHHQVEWQEAPKRAEQGGDNTPVGHYGPCVQQKRGHIPQHQQQYAKTCVLNKGTGLVTSGMSTQIYAGEKKAPEPRKCTKQLLHQRAAPKIRATYHHGPSQEYQNSANSE